MTGQKKRLKRSKGFGSLQPYKIPSKDLHEEHSFKIYRKYSSIEDLTTPIGTVDILWDKGFG